MKYKILIAEDDVLISESLRDCLESLGHKVLAIVNDKYEARKVLEQKPDIAFLDIRMHGVKEGFKIAEIINQDFKIPFMFITSYADPETVKEASLFGPVGYLVKPFDDTDVFAALEIAMVNQITGQRVEIKDGHSKVVLNALDINYVKADDNYVEVHTNEGKILERITLDGIRERLPKFFERCHRSYLVNTQLISKTTSKELILKDGQKVPLSKSYRKNFL